MSARSADAARPMPIADTAEARLAALEYENAKLRKINRVLVDRAERDMAAQGNEFSLFQTAVILDDLVRHRTAELTSLNQRLLHEIALRRKAEDHMRQAKVQAERASATKTTFIATVLHDLYQPLTAARLFLTSLAESQLPARHVRLTANIAKALDFMDALLEGVVDISRLDTGAIRCTLTDFALGEVLERLYVEYAPQYHTRSLGLRLAPTSVVVRSDRTLVERVLRNFLSNALRYTPKGRILLGCRRLPGGVRVEVWDQGIGIPKRKCKDIFREFYQLRSSTDINAKGFGLGLAIVERIGRMLDMRVKVRSWLGKGSVFSIDLPFSFGRTIAPPPQPAGEPDVSGKAVLVIENEADVLEGLTSLLESWDHIPTAATSLDEAADMLERRRVVPDVIIANEDLVTGSRSGAEMARLTALCSPPVPTILIAGGRFSGPRGTGRNAKRTRGSPVLTKPIKPVRLRALLNRLLA